jgi:hypothetical protein
MLVGAGSRSTGSETGPEVGEVEAKLEDGASDEEDEADTGTGGAEAGETGVVFEVVVVVAGGFTTVVPPVLPPPPPPPLPALLPSTGNTYPATHSYTHPEPSAPSLSAASAV